MWPRRLNRETMEAGYQGFNFKDSSTGRSASETAISPRHVRDRNNQRTIILWEAPTDTVTRETALTTSVRAKPRSHFKKRRVRDSLHYQAGSRENTTMISFHPSKRDEGRVRRWKHDNGLFLHLSKPGPRRTRRWILFTPLRAGRVR